MSDGSTPSEPKLDGMGLLRYESWKEFLVLVVLVVSVVSVVSPHSRLQFCYGGASPNC
jgi:hypothetical protein